LESFQVLCRPVIGELLDPVEACNGRALRSCAGLSWESFQVLGRPVIGELSGPVQACNRRAFRSYAGL